MHIWLSTFRHGFHKCHLTIYTQSLHNSNFTLLLQTSSSKCNLPDKRCESGGHQPTGGDPRYEDDGGLARLQGLLYKPGKLKILVCM